MAMRRKYPDCQQEQSNCSCCSLVNYGRDCHNNHIGRIEWLRLSQEMTQKQLAEKAGITIRMVQYLEGGERKIENTSLRVALDLADALDVDVRELM